MRVVVISNDVTPGFGVPVAAPGLRAAGLAEGLRAHGHDVTTTVPSDLLAQLFGCEFPPAPESTVVVAPTELNSFVADSAADVVVFINSNLTPHLDPHARVHYVYDLFAPKVLELEASGAVDGDALAQLTATKGRALAMADSVWVNGARKVAYAKSWLDRPEVATQRIDFGRGSSQHVELSVVPMPIPLPGQIHPERRAIATSASLRIGIAGYAQRWSTLDEVHPGHQLLIDRGFELHVLLPGHWGGNTEPPPMALPDGAIIHEGPLEFEEFAHWVQSMDAMVDVFRPSPERRYAMITRSAVALRLGVPLIHAVDSEISDIVREFNAGWVLDADDQTAWAEVCDALVDSDSLATATAGAQRASHERFDPTQALGNASHMLSTQAGLT